MTGPVPRASLMRLPASPPLPVPDPSSPPPPRRLKVGALARRTGLTVRALHHYEEVGLLVPAGRTDAGHRIYGDAEVRRLHQITSLRQLGFTLQEIADVLDDPQHTLGATLERHIDGLRARIREEEELCRELEALRDRLGREDEFIPLGDLTESVHRTVLVEIYFSGEQLDRLETRREEMGRGAMARGQAEWGVLLEEFRSFMERGVPADDPEVGELARRAAALVREFTGGDPRMAASLRRMYEAEGPDRVLEHQGVSLAPGVWEYMARARAEHGSEPS